MEKREDKKLRRIGITSESQKNISPRLNPRDFFKTIGIKPLGDGEMDCLDFQNAILKRNDPELINAFHSNKGSCDFFHDSLDLVKQFHGLEHNRLYRVAEELARVPVPPTSRILDIGGGPGHLAFWMAKIWDCPVTVADKYSHLGEQWAKEIGEHRVTFVEALLPDLNPLESEQYDIVLLSRVLSFILDKSLHYNINNFSTIDYLESAQAKKAIESIEKLLEGIIRVLSPEGKVVIIESWSDARVLIIARAFRRGLFPDVRFFPPERVSIDFSTIAFSRIAPPTYIKDLALALAATPEFGTATTLGGRAAEAIRQIFADPSPTMLLEYTRGDDRTLF